MGKRLSRVDEGEAFLTWRTILLKPTDEYTYTNGLGSTPYIGRGTNTKRITDTQEHSSKAEDKGETQYTREVKFNIQFSLCKINCKFYTHVDMKMDKYRGLIFSHCFWPDSHLFAGLVAVSLRRYIWGSSFRKHGASGPLINQGPSKGLNDPRWRWGGGSLIHTLIRGINCLKG